MNQRVDASGLEVKLTTGIEQGACASLRAETLLSWKHGNYGTLFSIIRPRFGVKVLPFRRQLLNNLWSEIRQIV